MYALSVFVEDREDPNHNDDDDDDDDEDDKQSFINYFRPQWTGVSVKLAQTLPRTV